MAAHIFVSLPLELRWQIYDIMFWLPHTLSLTKTSSRYERLSPFAGALGTSKRFRKEIQDWNRKFILPSYDGFQSYQELRRPDFLYHLPYYYILDCETVWNPAVISIVIEPQWPDIPLHFELPAPLRETDIKFARSPLVFGKRFPREDRDLHDLELLVSLEEWLAAIEDPSLSPVWLSSVSTVMDKTGTWARILHEHHQDLCDKYAKGWERCFRDIVSVQTHDWRSDGGGHPLLKYSGLTRWSD